DRGPHLAAYVVPTLDEPALRRELRNYLRRKLPGYMVPSAFVELPALPRTANRKIDRKALPPPGDMHYRQPGNPVPPRTKEEDDIAAIWRDTLLLDGIGVHDDFFELGGNSLQAARLVLRIGDQLNVILSLQDFFEAPSIAALAE